MRRELPADRNPCQSGKKRIQGIGFDINIIFIHRSTAPDQFFKILFTIYAGVGHVLGGFKLCGLPTASTQHLMDLGSTIDQSGKFHFFQQEFQLDVLLQFFKRRLPSQYPDLHPVQAWRVAGIK